MRLRATRTHATPPGRPALEAGTRPASLPVSYAQQRLWVLDRLESGNTAYNLIEALRLRGALDERALQRALETIVARHESLRTHLAEVDGDPRQVISLPPPVPLRVLDLQGLDADQQVEALHTAVQCEKQRPFALAEGPLFRVRLLKLGDEDHVLVRTCHHIVWDDWSQGVFSRELSRLYQAYREGRTNPLPPIEVQYADFAIWQRKGCNSEWIEPQLRYWTRQLKDSPPVSELPTDYPRPATPSSRSGQHVITLTPEITRALNAVSRQEGSTLFMVILTALTTLLYRYTGQHDLVVGTSVAGRTRCEIEDLIGYFVNLVALRTDLSGNPTFQELLNQVRQVTLAAQAHQDVPFERVLEELRAEHDASRTPVFQVLLNMLNVPTGTLELRDIIVERVSTGHPEAKFDLSVHVVNRGETISLALVYRTDLFTKETIERVSRHFACLLEALASNPRQRISAVPLRDHAAAERGRPSTSCFHRSFVAFARGDIEQSIAARFEQQVERYPRHVAVTTETGLMTYEELDRGANRTARVLLARGIGAASRTALLFDHDAPMIVGMLGALKAGTTYVPLDPRVPSDRLRSMLQDAGVSAMLTSGSSLRTALALTGGALPIVNVDEPGDVPSSRPSIRPHNPGAAAYLLYTSGSTGSPKAVAQSHRNVLHHIRAYTNNLTIDCDDRLSLLSTYTCDAAVMDVFGALLNGASLHLCDIRKTGVETLSDWIARHRITIYHSTPTVFRHFMSCSPSIETCRSVRLVVMGGEEVVSRDVDLFQRHFPAGAQFVNGLGPTESTVTLQYFVDSRAQMTKNRVPVGYPVDDTEVLLVNEDGEETTLLGELVIKSEHVALGYWQQPALTERAFLRDPRGGPKRLYRTGDLVRRLGDGSLEYLGRRDTQVKIRGHRVELTEIEANILRLETVKEALVLAFEESGERKLVAYIVGYGAAAPTEHHLRQFLKARLPHYMIPSAVIVVPALPLKPNGKVDRHALPVPLLPKAREQETEEAPAVGVAHGSGGPGARTSEEEIVCGLFAEILGAAHVNGEDDLFSLGGHSLQATKLVSRIRARFGVELELQEIFEGTTIAAIAQRITGDQSGRKEETRDY